MEGVKPAQVAVAETPALTVTVSMVLPEPPVQYIVNDHTPAVTVCAGRLVNPKTEVTPPDADWIWQGVACAPTVWSMVKGTHRGPTPVPCRYSGLPAASLMGAREDPQTKAAMATAMAPTTTHPTRRRCGAMIRLTAGGAACSGRRSRGSRAPSSHRRSMRSRRRW